MDRIDPTLAPVNRRRVEMPPSRSVKHQPKEHSQAVGRRGLEPRTRGLIVRLGPVQSGAVESHFLLCSRLFRVGQLRSAAVPWSALARGGWTENGLKKLYGLTNLKKQDIHHQQKN